MTEDAKQRFRILRDFRCAIRRLRRKLKNWLFYIIKPLGDGVGYAIQKITGRDDFLFIAQITKEGKLTFETNSPEAREKAEEEFDKFCKEDHVEVWHPSRTMEDYYGEGKNGPRHRH